MSGEIALHSMLTGVAVATLKQKGSGGIKLLQFSPFKKQVLGSATENGSIYIWDCNTRAVTASFQSYHNSPVTGLAFSAVNHMLMCTAGLDQKVHFYDIQEKRVVKTMELDAPITSLAFYGEGHTIAIGTLYGNIQIYDLRATTTAKANLRGHEGSSVNWLDFINPRGKDRAATRSASFNSIPPKETAISTTPKPGDESPYPGGRFRTIEEIKQEAKLRVEMKRREQRESSNPESTMRSASPLPNSRPPTAPVLDNNPTVSDFSLKLQDVSKSPETKLSKPPTPDIVRPMSEMSQRPPIDRAAVKPQEPGPHEELKSIPESKSVSDYRKKVEISGTENIIDSSRIETIEERLDRQDNSINGLRDDVHNLHIELIRQFMIQQSDLRGMLEEYSSANS